MKKTTVAVMLTLGLGVAAHATIIASDDFNYADGALTGNNGGTGWSGAYTDGGNSLLVASSQIDETGAVPGEVGVNFRGISQVINLTNFADGEIWMGFDGNLVLTGSWGYGGISPFEGGGEKGIIGAVVGLDMFGIAGNDNGATGSNRTVVKFDLNTDAISLWTGAAGSVVDVSGAALQTGSYNINGTDNLRFALNSTDAGGSIQIDNFVMGTTANDVIPEPATLGMVALFGGGILFIRRKLAM